MENTQITVDDLHPPPPGKSSWPWEVGNAQSLAEKAESSSILYPFSNKPWPKISIVTPSYNQGQFIEETIRSVLLQGYPDLEYIIIDGGSTDGSLDIIKKYEPWLAYWASEPDAGMYEAINKGFAQATGDIMAWSNTDDVYLPQALRIIGSVFQTLPEVTWLTSLWKVQWDESSREITRYKVKGFNRRAFYRGRNLLGNNQCAMYMIQQQSTFWRRTLWEQAGGKVDDNLLLAGDFELWAKFFNYADLYAVDKPLGVFRSQPNQKTATQAQEYLCEAEKAFKYYGGRYPFVIGGWMRSNLLVRIPVKYLKYFPIFSFIAPIIKRTSEGEWKIQKHRFV